MGLNQEQKDSIKKVAKGLALGIAAKLIGNLLATSYEKQSIKGKEERHATESETALQKDANQASKTEKNLSDDSVSAQKGNVKASNTDGNLQQADAKGMDSGASACMTKAGATDIAAKGLKLN